MVIALDVPFDFELSRTTCRAPTTTVEVIKAQITPKAKAIPNVVKGGSGDIMLARNAETVVITARESGTDNFAQVLIQATDGSSYCSRSVLFAL